MATRKQTRPNGGIENRSTGINGITYHERVARGHEEYYYARMVIDQEGRRKNVTFFIGTENTWTAARDRKAFAAAKRFDRAYRRYQKHGGTHPLDDPELRYRAGA